MVRYKLNAVGFRFPGARKERFSGEFNQSWRKFLKSFAKNAAIKAPIKAPIALLASGILLFAFGKLGHFDCKNYANQTSQFVNSPEKRTRYVSARMPNATS